MSTTTVITYQYEKFWQLFVACYKGLLQLSIKYSLLLDKQEEIFIPMEIINLIIIFVIRIKIKKVQDDIFHGIPFPCSNRECIIEFWKTCSPKFGEYYSHCENKNCHIMESYYDMEWNSCNTCSITYCNDCAAQENWFWSGQDNICQECNNYSEYNEDYNHSNEFSSKEENST